MVHPLGGPRAAATRARSRRQGYDLIVGLDPVGRQTWQAPERTGMVCIPPKVCYLADRSHHRRAIMNEHAKSSHPLPIDETVRTRDELAEILTLVQTGKTRPTPILPVHHAASGTVSSTGSGPPWCARVPSTRPLELFEVVDNPREVVDAIFKYYEHRGLGLSAEGQEILLHL